MSEWVGWRWAFVLVGLWLVGSAAVIARELPGWCVKTVPSSDRLQVATVLRDPSSRVLYAVTLVEGALVFGVLSFVPSALHRRFGVSLTTAGAVLALFGVGGLVYARSVGPLLDRLSRDRLATFGGALLCVAFMVLATMPLWWWGLPACWAAGLGFYMLHGTLQASATQLSESARGTAVSIFACALFLGQSVGVSVMAQAYAAGVLDGAMAAAGVALLILAAVFGARLRVAT
jgi:predicted MFS family arabinose efflux permease